jgi:hypothetical protein
LRPADPVISQTTSPTMMSHSIWVPHHTPASTDIRSMSAMCLNRGQGFFQSITAVV